MYVYIYIDRDVYTYWGMAINPSIVIYIASFWGFPLWDDHDLSAHDLTHGFDGFSPRGYPLVNAYITMENHHAIHGKSHYFYGHFQ